MTDRPKPIPATRDDFCGEVPVTIVVNSGQPVTLNGGLTTRDDLTYIERQQMRRAYSDHAPVPSTSDLFKRIEALEKEVALLKSRTEPPPTE